MKIFLQIIALLPGIISAIAQVEQFVPVGGAGKAKLDFVLGIIQDTVGDVTGLIEPITKVVARLVSLANATGSFKAR